MRGEIVAHELPHDFPRLDRAAGVMRLHDDVLKFKQARVDVRLVPEHIERRAADSPFGEGGDERRFVDDRAARDVDEQSFWPEGVEYGRVD